jgi:hypothetical protein
MIPENANEIKNILQDDIAAAKCWEDRPHLEVVDYGADGTIWTVQLTGDVDVTKLAPRLRERSGLAGGFATCVETYEVIIDRKEIHSVICKSVELWAIA